MIRAQPGFCAYQGWQRFLGWNAGFGCRRHSPVTVPDALWVLLSPAGRRPHDLPRGELRRQAGDRRPVSNDDHPRLPMLVNQAMVWSTTPRRFGFDQLPGQWLSSLKFRSSTRWPRRRGALKVSLACSKPPGSLVPLSGRSSDATRSK